VKPCPATLATVRTNAARAFSATVSTVTSGAVVSSAWIIEKA